MVRVKIVLLLSGMLLASIIFLSETGSGERATEYSVSSEEAAADSGKIPELRQAYSNNQEPAHLDISSIMEDPVLTANEKFDQLWKEFKIHDRDPYFAQYLLDTMQFIKSGNKQEIVDRIEASLHRGSYADEVKRSLVNLLAAQFARDASIPPAAEWQLSGNTSVIASLRRAAHASDPVVAHQATLQFSRIAETNESIALLREARAGGTISTGEYAKELTLHLPLIEDPAQQHALMETIGNLNLPKQEIAEIVATMAQLPHAIASLAPETRQLMRRVLDANPPTFSNDSVELDVLSLARYNNWASASALIDSSLSGEPVPSLLATLVMRPGTDARALIAVTASRMSDSVVDVLIGRGLVDDVRSRLDQFELASLNNAEASRIVAEIKTRMTERAHHPTASQQPR